MTLIMICYDIIIIDIFAVIQKLYIFNLVNNSYKITRLYMYTHARTHARTHRARARVCVCTHMYVYIFI